MYRLKTITSLVLATLAALGSATHISFDDNFDTLKALPDEGRLSPVGVYNNLNFTNFFVNQPGIPGVITLNGVEPESSPNQALGGTSSTTLSALTIPSPHSPPIKSFALNSFYYGCSVATLQAGVALATACNITVNGYASTAASAKPVVTQTFVFKPAETVTVMMPPAFGTFKTGFQKLVKATFVQTPGTPLTVQLLDDIVGSVETA